MPLREATAADRDAILAVHRSAFGEEGGTIATLVDELLDDPSGQPALSLVVEKEGQLLGHVLFTPVRVDGHADANGYILSPLAVDPDNQRGGIGSALIREGLERLKAKSVEFVLVLGDPKYYSRSGFAAGHQLAPPHAIPYPEAWMAQALTEGTLDALAGTVQCADALNAPEHW